MGFRTFQMEMHIPHFVLREQPLASDDASLKDARESTLKKWTDLSFLNTTKQKLSTQRKYYMYKARFSLLICGSSNRQWDGYAFADRDIEGENLDEEDFSYRGIYSDPIASDGELDPNQPVPDANNPITDPREYFLMVLATRMHSVHKEWENLVRMVDRSITEHVCDSVLLHSTKLLFSLNRLHLVQESQHGPVLTDDFELAEEQCCKKSKEAFEWTQQTMKLLSQLLDGTSRTINAWDGFNDHNGDIGYFSNVEMSEKCGTSQDRIEIWLRAIDESFKELEDLRRRLKILRGDCLRSAESVRFPSSYQNHEC
jgi:hypothetical protein